MHDFFVLLPDETKESMSFYIGDILKKDKRIDEKAIEILADKNTVVFCIRRFIAYASIAGGIRV